MTKTTKVVGIDGREFLVRVVEYGDTYGRDDCLTHGPDGYDGGPMVEFYDTTGYDRSFGDRGKFVSRYYLSTLAESATLWRGLSLYGREKVWSLPGESVTEAVTFAKSITEGV